MGVPGISECLLLFTLDIQNPIYFVNFEQTRYSIGDASKSREISNFNFSVFVIRGISTVKIQNLKNLSNR